MFGLGLGDNPQAVVTTTPRPIKLVKALVADSLSEHPTVIITRGTTYENKENLAPGFYTKIITAYEGTRLGRQELMAEILDDNPGALFHLTLIEGARVRKAPPLTRIVVAINPAVSSNENSDETGIVVAGIDGRDPCHAYILEDLSGIYTPDEWAKAAVTAFHRWERRPGGGRGKQRRRPGGGQPPHPGTSTFRTRPSTPAAGRQSGLNLWLRCMSRPAFITSACSRTSRTRLRTGTRKPTKIRQIEWTRWCGP